MNIYANLSLSPSLGRRFELLERSDYNKRSEHLKDLQSQHQETARCSPEE